MKCYYIDSVNGKTVFIAKEVPKPQPKAGEILVKVKAASLNRGEILASITMHKVHEPHPAGADCAGEVEAVGEGDVGNPLVRRELALDDPLTLGVGVAFLVRPDPEPKSRELRQLAPPAERLERRARAAVAAGIERSHRMERRDGEWRILHRVVVRDWFREFGDSSEWDKGQLPQTLGYGKTEPLSLGLRKPEDVSYRLLRSS